MRQSILDCEKARTRARQLKILCHCARFSGTGSGTDFLSNFHGCSLAKKGTGTLIEHARRLPYSELVSHGRLSGGQIMRLYTNAHLKMNISAAMESNLSP